MRTEMRLGIIALAAVCLCSCTTTRTAPRFTQPSTQPIRQGVQNAKTHVQSAKKQAQELEKVAERDCPELKLQIIDLESSLDTALSDLSTAEGARTQLDAQLQDQTTKANKLADSYDKSQLTIKAKDAAIWKRNRIILALGGLLLASVAWIFRKPLFLLIGGLGV